MNEHQSNPEAQMAHADLRVVALNSARPSLLATLKGTGIEQDG